MGTIADDINELYALVKKVEDGIRNAAAMKQFDMDVLHGTMTVIGNMHDNTIVEVNAAVMYANDLMDDYIKVLRQIKSKLNGKATILRMIGESNGGQ